MKPRRVVLAGTGTDVGKTFYAQRIARCLLARGIAVCALKPTETAFGSLEDSDAAAIASAAGHAPVRPYFVHEDPLGPLAASRRTRSELSLAAISEWVESHEARLFTPRHGAGEQVSLVETAGGLFTPLTPRETNFDLIDAVRADACILVARNRLGTLHDVLAVHTAVGVSDRVPMAVILNTMADDAPATNLEDLRLCGIAQVARDPDDIALSQLVAELLSLA